MQAFGLSFDDALEECGFTKLLAAAALVDGYDGITTELLEATFHDIHQADRTGMTPLHWACKRFDNQAIEILLR